MKTPLSVITTFVACATSFLSTVHGGSLLSDTFSTDTSASYSAGGFGTTSGSFNVSGGTLNVTTPAAGGFDYYIITRPFTAPLGTLLVGDSVTVSLTFKPTTIPAQDGNLNNSLALGLVSRGANGATGTFGGFAGAINPTGGSFTASVASDTGTNSLFFAGSDTSFNGYFSPGTVTANSNYSWSTTVTKLAGTDQFSASTTFNGSTGTSTFTNSTGNSLDGFGLAFNKSYATSLGFSIDDLSVTTTAVPEPSTYFGGFALLLLTGVWSYRRGLFHRS